MQIRKIYIICYSRKYNLVSQILFLRRAMLKLVTTVCLCVVLYLLLHYNNFCHTFALVVVQTVKYRCMIWPIYHKIMGSFKWWCVIFLSPSWRPFNFFLIVLTGCSGYHTTWWPPSTSSSKQHTNYGDTNTTRLFMSYCFSHLVYRRNGIWPV